MIKQFKNKDLKNIIIDLYNDNNIIIDENLKNQLQISSKTQYYKLEKYYNEIKQKITDLLISNISSRKESIEITPINEKKEIETQTEYFKEIETQTEYFKENEKTINELKTELFNCKQNLSDYKYKLLNHKRIIKELQNKNKDTYSSSNNTDDEKNNIIKEKRKYNYHEMVELSSHSIINELQKLSRHNLKQLYNKYFSTKLNRQLTIYN